MTVTLKTIQSVPSFPTLPQEIAVIPSGNSGSEAFWSQDPFTL